MTRGMGSLVERLDRLPVPPLPATAERDVAALLERLAVDDAEASMFRQMCGFDRYPRATLRSGRWEDSAPHGTQAGVRFHQEQRTTLCRPCRRWVYAREVHGTEQSCQAHYADGTPLCAVCQEWADDKHRRANIAPGVGCGTPAGCRRHRRLGEPICARCRAADAKYAAKRKDRRKDPDAKSDQKAGNDRCSSAKTSPRTARSAASTGNGSSSAPTFRTPSNSWDS